MAEYIDRTQLETDTEWSEYDDDFISYSKSQINSLPTADVIPIPEGATNGDMIMTMFPNVKWWVNEDNEVFTDMPWKPEKCVYFDLDWWNAPYKTEKWVNFAEELKDVFEEEVEE